MSDSDSAETVGKVVGERSEYQARLDRQAGLGIIEVMIALVIFSTAILGIVGTAAHVGGIMNTSHVRLFAGSICRAQLEELLATPYDSLVNGTVDTQGVHMTWNVAQSSAAKEILLVYEYDVPRGARSDTLAAAMLRP
ncbi:MAG: hypothetical protein V3U13_04420 [Gemmatimonadota bacterium]